MPKFQTGRKQSERDTIQESNTHDPPTILIDHDNKLNTDNPTSGNEITTISTIFQISLFYIILYLKIFSKNLYRIFNTIQNELS